MADGTERAWADLGKRPQDKVGRNADVRFDPAINSYVLKCFGQEISVCPGRREIQGDSPVAVLLLGKLRYFFELAVLRYLSGASAVPLSGLLVRPGDLKGGRLFEGGSHVLPLEKIARKYGADVPGFLARGLELGGEKAAGGDAALRLWPFPRVRVIVLLWKACAEFEARADLLFDSTCELHLPPDIVWATAMLSILLLLADHA